VPPFLFVQLTGILLPMCNLYGVTKSQQAIREPPRAMGMITP